MEGPHRIRPVDFRRPAKFGRDSARRLTQAYDSFCRLASTRLAAELRVPIELRPHTGADQVPYRVVIADMPQDAIIVVLDLDPGDGQVALAFELPLAVALVDGLLGGGGTPRRQLPPALTDLETRVFGRAVRSLLDPLSATWRELAGVDLHVHGTPTSPLNLTLAAPSEPTLLMQADVELGMLMSPLRFLLPHAAIEPVLDRLDAQHQLRSTPSAADARAVRSAMAGVDVELRAEAGAVELPAERILALRPGHVLRLRRSATAGVVLYAGDVAAYLATPGRNGNRRAVQVVAECEEPT